MSLIIVEGCDGAGKTTLIEKILKRYHGSKMFHHGAYLGQKEIAHHYMTSVYTGYRIPESLMVMDRSWIAEPIYGKAMRDGENRIAPWQRRMLERVALGAGVITIFCAPEFVACERAWQSRLAKEYPKRSGQLVEIYKGYELAMDACFSPKLHYDWTRADTSMFLEILDEKLIEQHRVEPTIGVNAKAKPVLLIGDAPGTSAPSRIDLPFVSLATTYKKSGCSVWLANQLEDWGVPENKLAWVNQCDLHPNEFIDLTAYRLIIALGGKAMEWCERYEVNAVATYHPQYQKRFRFTSPYDLKPLLEHAIIGEGE